MRNLTNACFPFKEGNGWLKGYEHHPALPSFKDFRLALNVAFGMSFFPLSPKKSCPKKQHKKHLFL